MLKENPMSVNKKGYFQGGGGVNEPTPGEKKYKSDPALVVQPRFEEPFYYNYDLYTIPGMEDIGPGTGYHGLQNYDSVQEFLEARRSRMKGRYEADDSWQLDSGKRTKENPGIKARAAIFERIIKTAGPNYDLGKGLYQEMSDGKVDSVEEFREEEDHGPGAFFADDNADHMLPPKEHGTSIYDWKNSPYQGTPGPKKKKKKDVNHIDFPIDEQVNHYNQMIYPGEEQYHKPRLVGPLGPAGNDDYSLFPGDIGPELFQSSFQSGQIAGEHSYLPENDFDGRSADALNFGRDYDEETKPARGLHEDILQKLFNKYLTPSEDGLFGLPDGVDPEGHDADQTEQVEEPFTGTSDIGTDIYEDKWNI
jgi:hypothetical protein